VINGTVSNSSFSATLTAEEAEGSTNASADYTVVIASDDATGAPTGDGYATISSQKGKATIAGTLADGTSFSQSVPISDTTGDIPVYASLYNGKGLIQGFLSVGTPTSLSLYWVHPTHSGLFDTAFISTCPVTLSTWTPGSTAGAVVATMTSLTIGTNNYGITNLVSGKITDGKTLSGSVNLSNGKFTVTVGKGASAVTGHGVILLNGPTGGGYFLKGTDAGLITLP
jgi:hypothetical protein